MGSIKQPENLKQYRDFPNESAHPLEITINSWRYIRDDYCQEKLAVGRGTYVFCYGLNFVPGVTAEQIMDIADSDSTFEAFFFPLKHGSPWCERCQGAGKLNWVDNAKGGIPRISVSEVGQYYKEFRRQPKTTMVYSRNSYYSRDRTLYLAPTIVDEGELLCRDCKGTGLWLNATVHIFNGFPRIKSMILYQGGPDDYAPMLKMPG